MRIVVVHATAAETAEPTATEEKDNDNNDDPPTAETAATVVIPAHKQDLLWTYSRFLIGKLL